MFAVLPLIPLVGALLLVTLRDKDFHIPFISTSLVLLLGMVSLKGVFVGGPLTYSMVWPGPFSPSLRVDGLSAIFVLLTAFVWWVVSLYAPEYMKHEGKVQVFNICLLLTLSGVMGVFLAGDMLTLLLCFEIMTITSFFWVIHRWNAEAIRAGYFYLFFSIFGGLLVALGIVLVGAAGGSIAIGTGPVVALTPRMFSWGLAAMVAGFGVKAGMVPLHLWLPHAHSVAPTPASALLSGVLIKVGAYGLIRVGQMAGWGMELSSATSWLGPGVTILGICTMLLGVTAALLQSDAKRLLAYHSVSQMGYIILGLGIGLYLGPQGSLGLVGAIYHIVNHALFKAALFLGVGVIYIATKETNLYNLGGLLRKFPVTALLMLVAVLGITGAPGLNGYASKTILHHAVSQAALGGTPLGIWAERLFLVVGVGTAASFTKLFYLMFLGKPTEIEVAEGESWQFRVAMGLLAVAMLVIGLRPSLFTTAWAVPAAKSLGMANAPAAFAHINFWNGADILGMVITLGLGMAFCWVGLKTGLFHWHPSRFLTLEGLGGMAYQGLICVAGGVAGLYRRIVAAIERRLRNGGLRLLAAGQRLDHPGGITVGTMSFSEISANAGLLIASLIVLILVYTYMDLGSYVRLPFSASRWMGWLGR